LTEDLDDDDLLQLFDSFDIVNDCCETYTCNRYSHYAVSLAYHVIAMWFIKCRQPFKRGFVQYIVKVCFLMHFLIFS